MVTPILNPRTTEPMVFDVPRGGRGETSDGGRGETSDGGRGETSDGGRGETSDGGRGETSDGGRGESWGEKSFAPTIHNTPCT